MYWKTALLASGVVSKGDEATYLTNPFRSSDHAFTTQFYVNTADKWIKMSDLKKKT